MRISQRAFALLLIAVATVLLVYPLWSLVDATGVEEESEKLTSQDSQESASLASSAASPYEDSRLVIPSIGVDMPIVEGFDDSALEKGAWRLPETSIPEQGGNTVIGAHRFKNVPPHPETFYLLDKVQEGDEILVHWSGEVYRYTVTSSRQISPYDVSVLEPTSASQITLFTCAPLFSDAERLVVTAELIE